ADAELIEDELHTWKPAEARLGHIEADLEIEEIRPAIVPDDDVLALVEVHIGDTAAMHGAEGRAEGGEEVRVDALILAQRMAGDELARHRVAQLAAAGEDRTERGRDLRQGRGGGQAAG